MTRRIVFDFETRCDVSVLDVGAWKYARHPSNEILCVSWRVREDNEQGPVLTAIACPGSEGRAAVERRVRDAGFIVAPYGDFALWLAASDVWVAHNIGFELAHLARHFPDALKAAAHLSCTASRSRRLGIPGALEGACNVMRTPHRKSVEGHRVMLQVSQPRPRWNSTQEGPKWFDDADRLSATAIYCAQDILAECDLDERLPELSAHEYAIWRQVEDANRRGLKFDVDLLDAMEPLLGDSNAATLAEVRALTGDPNFSLTAVQAVRDFCGQRGVYLENLQKETVDSVLTRHRTGARVVDPLVIKVLEGRQTVGKSSNAKLPAMRDRLEDDGFARDYSIYFGAHTGRQTGAKVNPLNMPKPYKGYDQEVVLDAIRRSDVAKLEALRVSPALAVSASLRGTLVAPEGKKFVIGDYKTIEPCCIFTLAGQWDAVEIIRNHGDIYCDLGPHIFGRAITKADKQERDLCKKVVLGCGYGLGFDMFLVKMRMEGVELAEDLLRRAHGSYRLRFDRVVPLWNGLGAAAVSATRTPHTRYKYGPVSYIFDGYWLVCELPSGRPFYYPNARLQPGKYSDELVYDGRTRTGGWGDVRTWGGSLLENCAQSISRDITMEDKLETQRRYGWHVPLDVYDEIVAECPEDEANAFEKLYAVMARERAWLPGMPIDAEGFVAKRYRKE